MARGVETGVGSWAALVLLLVSSSVVLGLQWNKECDGGLRTWLLTAICVTAICSILGVLFHGRGDGTRPSRFLDDDDDDNDVWGGIDGRGVDTAGISVGVNGAGGGGDGLGSMGDANSVSTGRVTPSLKMEEGGAGINGGGVAEGATGEQGRRDSMGEESIVSGVPSSISYRLASHSSSLQHRYFGPGPKLFPDAIFFILVVSQWFLAGWSVVGAALYFRLFTGNRTCSPLLRHWTLLVVIIGFLSCLLAVCYSGIMCCMLGGPFRRRGKGRDESDGFQGEFPSTGDGAGAADIPDLM